MRPRSPIASSAGVIGPVLLLLASCTPKVAVEAPKDPIVINLNVKIEQEVRLNVEEEIAYLLTEQKGLFSEPAAEPAAGEPGELGRRRSPVAQQVRRIDAAKEAGLIGERIDGYLGVVDPGATSDVVALVEEINAGRKTEYQEIADREGVPLEVVAQIAGETLIEETAGGRFVMGADARWKRK